MGIKLLDLCKAHDLQILNGRTTGDRGGSFTFHDTAQGASSIDVAVASDTLCSRVSSFVVLPQSDISPHCKIVTRIKNLRANIQPLKKKEYEWIPLPKKYRWTGGSADQLSTALSSPLVCDTIIECNLYIEAGLVDPAAKKLTEVFTRAADVALELKTEGVGRLPHSFKHKQKPKK